MFIFEVIWIDILLDFIEGLFMYGGKFVILVVMDRLSKYVNFISILYFYLIVLIVQDFFDNIFLLYGIVRRMVSNRDSVFLS